MKKHFRGTSILVVLAIIFTILFNYGTVISFGSNNPTYIEVEAMGTGAVGDPMFNDGIWGPGSQQTGILRLRNNYSNRIKVTNLALTMKLEAYVDNAYVPVVDPDLYRQYAENMELTISRGYLMLFAEDIYTGNFYDMLYQAGNVNFEGHHLPEGKQFNVSRNDTVDLRYTVTMSEEAGNQLQGLKATVDFIVNLQENPVPVQDDDDDDDDYDDTEEIYEEIEDIEIPLGQHWAHDCIVILMEEGIVQGYPDGSIQPERTITRAETAAIIARALDLEEKSPLLTGYLDPIPGWARGSVIASTQSGIFKGYPMFIGKVFRPDNLITREEMATALMRAFELKLEEEQSLSFLDREEISEWALEYVEVGVQHEIILGYPDNTFKPSDYITRAEAFTMICKLSGYHIEHQE